MTEMFSCGHPQAEGRARPAPAQLLVGEVAAFCGRGNGSGTASSTPGDQVLWEPTVGPSRRGSAGVTAHQPSGHSPDPVSIRLGLCCNLPPAGDGGARPSFGKLPSPLSVHVAQAGLTLCQPRPPRSHTDEHTYALVHTHVLPHKPTLTRPHSTYFLTSGWTPDMVC